MKRLLRNFVLTAALCIPASLLCARDADLLAGKWSVKKTNEQGQNYLQTVEVKQNTFVFEILSTEENAILHAEGDFKLEKLGPFSVARFSHIRAGQSASDMQDVDDEYVSIYAVDTDTWTLAGGFDKERDQKPSLDVYRRVRAAAQTKTLVIDALEMSDTPQSSTWYLCLEVTAGGVTRRYHLDNKGYDKNDVTIPLALEMPRMKVGQKCSFKLQLDDVDSDACTDEADNRSTGEFTASEQGAQTYKPETHWRYAMRWHLK